MQILKDKDKVIKLLRLFPKYRDNDQKLQIAIWKRDVRQKKGRNYYDLTAKEIEQYIEDFTFTNALSIVRNRQQLQRLNKGLRGPSWYKRNHVEEPETRDEIINYNK